MSVAVLRDREEMVPIEHETSERIVRAMVFAVPPAAVALGRWSA